VYVLPAIDGAWSRAGTLPLARYGATAVVMGSSLWVIGGLTTTATSFSSTNRVEVYNPTTQGFTAGAPMSTGRAYFASAQTPDGRLWAFGGLVTGNTTTAASEVYDPGAGRWSTVAAMPTALGGSGSLLASDGRLYVVGGYATTGYTNATLSFDFTAQRWSTGPTLPLARGFGSLAEAPAGVLIHFGGRDTNMRGLSNVWAYTLGSTAWR
jgi:N-acetylneuraminic acid mutarotase